MPFLTAQWRYLVVINSEVEPRILQPCVPRGTELDLFDGLCFVSMVGFLFDETRLFARLTVPLHASFEEANLRFYVKRHVGADVRRGVVFVKELVPSRSVICVARWVFHENQ